MPRYNPRLYEKNSSGSPSLKGGYKYIYIYIEETRIPFLFPERLASLSHSITNPMTLSFIFRLI